ncbi:hypothetical protein SAMN06296386_101387 [Lachnospiraceae bacterium]|nr:hypothetical protein SAMN06296386_101387 [Lachnospiraceae bacterium]
MKKMLYLCAIEWEWIAQRPHFLALELQKYFDLKVASPRHLFKKIDSQRNNKKAEKQCTFYLLPFQEKSPLMGRLSECLFRLGIGSLDKYDVIWIGSPLFVRYIPRSFKGRVVYDYMDDCVSMQTSERMKTIYRKAHERLLKRANSICVSSGYLYDLLPMVAKKKASIVYNAFNGNTVTPPRANTKKNVVKLGYVGTIAGWMDWKLLEKSVEQESGLEYHFWGPMDVNIPKNEHFIYHGIVEHDDISKVVEEMDALVMPFLVNDIVKAVDPVKLYEYISFGKNIICCAYEEVKKYSKHVWLYEDEKSYFKLIKQLKSNSLEMKYDEISQKEFLIKNTWECRADQIYQLLEGKN